MAHSPQSESPARHAGTPSGGAAPEGRHAWPDEACLAFISLIWGTTFVVVGGLVTRIPPIQLLVTRFLLAAALLAGLSWRRWPERGLALRRGGIVLGLWLATGFGFQTVALAYTTPARAAFITGFCVVLPPLIAGLLHWRLPHPRVLLAALAAALGMSLIAWPGRGGSVNAGDLLAAVSALGYGAHIYATGLYASRTRPDLLTASQVAVAGIVFSGVSVLALATLHLHPGEAGPAWATALAGRPMQWTLPILTAILYLACFATVLAYFLQTRSQRRVSPARAGILFALEPVFAAVISVALGYDAVTWRLVAGGLLVVGGIVVCTEEEADVKVPGVPR